MAACFFLRVDSGREFVTTVELSQKTAHSSVNGTPIIRSLYLNPSIISIDKRIAYNSDPYVDASTVFCLLENHKIGALFTNIRIPECDRLVSLHPAWSASTKQLITTS
jgi:hypothetical protein